MKTKYTVALSMLAGVAIGAVAVQGLHAQATKLKAYSINEQEPLDPSALNAYLPGGQDFIASRNRRNNLESRLCGIWRFYKPKSEGHARSYRNKVHYSRRHLILAGVRINECAADSTATR